MYNILSPDYKEEVKENLMEFILLENGYIDRHDMTIFSDEYWGDDSSISGAAETDEIEKLNFAQTEHGCHRSYRGCGGWNNWWSNRCRSGYCGSYNRGCHSHHRRHC